MDVTGSDSMCHICIDCLRDEALLRSAEVYRTAKKADEFGVVIPEVGLRFSQVQSRKQKIIDQLHNGVKHLMKKGKIDVYEGIGRILGLTSRRNTLR